MRQEVGFVFAFKLGESHKQALEDTKNYSDRDSHAMDIWSRCTRCGANVCSGVPLSPQEYEKPFNTITAAARTAGWGDNDENLV